MLLSCSATRESSFGSLADEINGLSEVERIIRTVEVDRIKGQLNEDDSNRWRLVTNHPLESERNDTKIKIDEIC